MDELSASLVDIMYASFSFAGIFEPAQVLNSSFFDGSVVGQSDLISGINYCINDLGYDQEDVVVDALYSTPRSLSQVDVSSWTSASMFLRFRTINSYYHEWDGLIRARYAFPNAEFRHIITPPNDKTIPDNWWPLNYNQKQIDAVVAQGVIDGSTDVPKD